MNDSTYDKPSKQDEEYSKTAIELAVIASNAIEELTSCIERIENETLREQTAAKVELILS